MGFELTRPLFLFAGAAALLLAVFVWSRLAPPLPPSRARLSLGLRILILLLLTASLAGFAFQHSPAEQSLLVVADLSASTQSASDVETATVQRILSERQGSDRAGVISFGRDPQVEVNIGTNPQFAEFQSRPNANYTDIASSLRLAGSILPTDTRRHVVIVSDGRANLGDAIAEARLLHAEGVRVDTVALNVPVGAEAYVDRLSAPNALNQGEQATAQAAIVSNVDTPATVRWYLDRNLLTTSQVDLKSGETTLTQAVKPVETGFHSVQVTIDPVRDTFAENNVGEALIRVVGPPHALLVEQSRGDAASLESALQSTGILATAITPEQLPKTASDLAAYQSVVLVNVPASRLGADGMALLQAATRDLGTGLVVIGGSDSYGPGGYAGTALETALPVQIELPQNMKKPPVAVMLVLETTEDQTGDRILRGAAESVVDQLTPRDSVGVTNGGFYGSGANNSLVQPLAPLTDKSKVKAAIDSMNLGDPPSYVPTLQQAEEELKKSKAGLKHIIILGDGDAEQSGDYQAVVNRIHDEGITVSAVQIGPPPQGTNLMQQIANWGHGRFYQSSSLDDVPQIFLKETNEALKPWIVEGDINPQLASLLQTLPGVPLNAFPTLTGYVATTPRAAADVVLQSPQGDPLLATWEYGLGRVLAWTSDAQGRWTAGLLSWPSANLFFGDIVRYSLPEAGDPTLQAEMQVQGDHTHLLVTTPSVSGSEVTINAVAPDLSDRQVTLASTGPDRFEGDLPTDQVGSYLVHVTQSAGGTVRHTNTFGLVVPYSPEYRDLGTDTNRLTAIAHAGGGTLVTDLSRLYALPVPPAQAAQSLDELLLVLAILLFPIDVALRRLILSVEDVPAWKAAFKRAPGRAVPAEATLSRLRQRVSDVRSTRAAKSQPPSPPRPPEKTIEELRAKRKR